VKGQVQQFADNERLPEDVGQIKTDVAELKAHTKVI
jgi:hypothetical protein